MQLGPCVLRWATIPPLTGSLSAMMTNNNKGALFSRAPHSWHLLIRIFLKFIQRYALGIYRGWFWFSFAVAALRRPIDRRLKGEITLPIFTSISSSLLLAPTASRPPPYPYMLAHSRSSSVLPCSSPRLSQCVAGRACSWEVCWSVSSVDVDGPWSEARAWLLKRSLFCASEPALPVVFRPCR